jgi:hypothetical protein
MNPAAPNEPPAFAAASDGLPRINLYTNVISLIGLFFVGLGLLMTITYAVFAISGTAENPYLDIAGYLIFPSIFVVGLTLVPLGIVGRYWRLRRKHIQYRATLRLDLSNPHTRRRLAGFVLFNAFIVLPVLAFSSYEGYLYTESSDFCGRACHSVMAPQATGHANSPHARVTCAACHIGEGASWFVKAKLSGLRQVYAVTFNTYRRPIPPAITELRPARETCEQCHWPAKFFGEQFKEIVHYSPDEQNTRRVVRMLLKVGGADESIGRVEGIHMHMMVSGMIEYIAEDPHLQKIPWVRYTPLDGPVRIFRSDGGAADAPPPQGIVRRVDCMDCHNRGAHHFYSPQTGVDLFLNVDRIDPNLPFVKREAVRALVASYSDNATAEREIERAITAFYQQNYPELWETRRAAIEKAAGNVRELYHRTFFPDMHVNWATYPENIGHLNSPGCIRCHDGLHKDAAGTAISSSCDTCHTFLNPLADRPASYAVGPFQHSLDQVVDPAYHAKLRCSQCHNGGELKLCRDCHQPDQELLDKWGKGQFRKTE